MTPERPYSADAWRIVAARGLRQFAYGLLGVALAVALNEDGFSPVAIGGLLTAALAWWRLRCEDRAMRRCSQNLTNSIPLVGTVVARPAIAPACRRIPG